MNIRTATLADHAAVCDLWSKAGLELSPSDSLEELAFTLGFHESLFLVAEDESRIVAAVLGCFDGRRGRVNHLAVDANYRGTSLGKQMMTELEERFRQVGCKKVNLLVRNDNLRVQGFYERLGYSTDDVTFMEKWIVE